MPDQYSITQYVQDLRRITAETTDENEIFKQLGPLAKRLVADRSWLEDRFFKPDEETGFSAYLLHEEDDHSLAVFAASWVPGMGVGPHDHGTWAVVAGVEGVERNIRYKRQDDRSDPTYAELEIKEESDAGPSDFFVLLAGNSIQRLFCTGPKRRFLQCKFERRNRCLCRSTDLPQSRDGFSANKKVLVFHCLYENRNRILC